MMIMKTTMKVMMTALALMVGIFCFTGPSIKYVTLVGEGVREGVTVCDRGRGAKSM